MNKKNHQKGKKDFWLVSKKTPKIKYTGGYNVIKTMHGAKDRQKSSIKSVLK